MLCIQRWNDSAAFRLYTYGVAHEFVSTHDDAVKYVRHMLVAVTWLCYGSNMAVIRL
jgi:hypothetical protein